MASGSAKLLRIDTDAAHTVSTLAGSGAAYGGFQDGPGHLARLLPQGGIVWSGANLLVSDPGNYRLRRVVPGATAASTQVSTFAGSGRIGLRNGDGATADIGLALGVTAAANGVIYLADPATGTVRALRR